uniref:Uncharacterized protein n=1 Tax=Populus trichocarpa TaxID=3694 RepID=A0A2K2BB75_POPTR
MVPRPSLHNKCFTLGDHGFNFQFLFQHMPLYSQQSLLGISYHKLYSTHFELSIFQLSPLQASWSSGLLPLRGRHKMLFTSQGINKELIKENS